MARTIRFHLDENIDGAIALGLRRRGVDVTTTAEAELAGSTDDEQLAHCVGAGRVMFTMDTDFLLLHSTNQNHPGIVFAHQQRITIGDAIRGILLIWEVLELDEMRGRLEYLG